MEIPQSEQQILDEYFYFVILKIQRVDIEY